MYLFYSHDSTDEDQESTLASCNNGWLLDEKLKIAKTDTST